MKTEVLKNFIVLEGLDGSGTTTQLNNLYNTLFENGIKCEKTFEPTDNEIGKLIRQILRKEINKEPKTISKLFTADRYEHIYGKNGIKENCEMGKYVICDRYLFSSLAYQSPECGYDFVKEINSYFPLPEYLFFIDVDVDTCQERINSRGEAVELFEASDYQRSVNNYYIKALDDFKDSGMKIFKIDGTQTPEEITKQIEYLIR